MFAVSRFRGEASLEQELNQVAEFWRSRPGCVRVEVMKNLDDDALWLLHSEWESVGAYRRAFNGYDAKMLLTPILSQAVDEPSAYLPADEVGENIPRGE